MARRWDDDDLLAELRAALEEQRSVPERAQEMARMAFTWRDPDPDIELELMSLVHDSVLHSVDTVRGDGRATPRIVVFESDDLTLEVEVGPTTLTCHVVPVLPGRLVVHTTDGAQHEAEPDDGGFFLMRRPESSPVRLSWIGEQARLVTDWFPV